jgi:saccharopine dehydrogenase-like NADP-dependent oxidoreductase
MTFAALVGTAIIAGPLSAAYAADIAPQTQAGVAATSSKGETVEQRIASLHTSLKITQAEETKWTAVAQSMRENAAAMDKLIAEGRTTPPQNMTALDDLKTYQKFAEAHVEGLKNLISSFTALYDAMPDAQKKVTDHVFQSAHQAASTRGQTG